ncbi:MAG: helix-turn-helix transcriptional regulator [Chloroflexi bacterium]|nr:helix-turn-helix transcriptional regulator [Chloroflexota bacterium]MBU1746320.1 helix-turn-helix transcriptional regulator [Chloroflexota bacterium]
MSHPDQLATFSLQVLRQARGLSREQLATGAGVQLAALVAYEEQGRYLAQASRRKLERYLGLTAGTLPDRPLRVLPADAPARTPASPWLRTLAEWQGQGVAVNVGDRPGRPLKGRLVAADATALLLAQGDEHWLVNAGRVNWVRPEGGHYPPVRGETARPLWTGALGAWTGLLVEVNVGLGEMLPGRLLDGDDLAVLLDYGGVYQLVRAGRVNWVCRKTTS